MSIPCKDGLLLCADKRALSLNNELDRADADDTLCKIYRIDKTVAFVTNGYCSLTKTFINDETNEIVSGKEEVLFDADSIVKNFFTTNNATQLEKYFPLLAKKLKEGYKIALTKLVAENLADNLNDHSDSNLHIFQTLFFTIDKQRNIKIYELTAKQGVEIGDLALIFRQRNPNPFSIRPQAYGFFYVYTEMEKGIDPSFNVYREAPLIKKLLLNYEEPANISVEDALSFAKIVFTATYNRYLDVKSPLSPLQKKLAPISKTMDCALISFDRGLRWLGQNMVVVED